GSELVDRAARSHVLENAVLEALHFDLLGLLQVGVVRRQRPVGDQHRHPLRRVVGPEHAVRLLVDEVPRRDFRLRQQRQGLLLAELRLERVGVFLLRLHALDHLVERVWIRGARGGRQDDGERAQHRREALPNRHAEPNARPPGRISGRASYTQSKSRLFMKRILLAISLLLAVTGVHGAVQYEFRQTFHSDVDTMPSNDMTGRAVIDGDRYRVEFLSGSAFPAGSYVISTNAARQQVWVDPSKKSYVEVNAAGVASSLGSRHITIANKKIDVTPMPDHPIVAGLPTDHYRMVMSYEITLPFGQLLLKQNVTTVIDKWTTMAYAGVAEGFLGGIRTGNADLDELFDNENTKI